MSEYENGSSARITMTQKAYFSVILLLETVLKQPVCSLRTHWPVRF